MSTLSAQSGLKTILVVDDAAICREPIAEILRARGFDVVCASDGAEALRMLNAKSVDLILLDVKMPGMDGISLLRVIRRHPSRRRLPVILLTDLADTETVREAARLGVADYLLKATFTTEGLLSRVIHHLDTEARGVTESIRGTSTAATDSVPSSPSSSLSSSSPSSPTSPGPARGSPPGGTETPAATRTWDRKQVLSRIRRTLDLRPVPPVLHYVISQTNSAQTSLHDIADTIRHDQSLALRVMKVANSSFYATSRPAQNLMEAAGRLGMSGIRNAVVTIVTMDHFSTATGGGIIPQRFWEHAMGAAAIAQSLAERTGRDDHEEIFLAGLLHDIGRLVLSVTFPEEYRAVLAGADSRDIRLDLAEREVFELSSAEVTQEVLNYMKLPGDVVAAAWLHDRSAKEIAVAQRDWAPAIMVALADRLAHALLLGHSGNSDLTDWGEFLKAISVEPRVAGAIGREVARKVRETDLFYSCHADSDFLGPFATELADGAEHSRKVAVIAASAPDDPLSLFLEQFGWLETEEPEVALLFEEDDSAAESNSAKLASLEERCERRLPALRVSSSGNETAEVDAIDGRPGQRLSLPMRYSDLIDAILEAR